MIRAFDTKHYTFEEEHGSIKIINRGGKHFFVMRDELLLYITHLVRQQRIAELENQTSAQILGIR